MWKHQIIELMATLGKMERVWASLALMAEKAVVFHLDSLGAAAARVVAGAEGKQLFHGEMAYDGGLPSRVMLLEYPGSALDGIGPALDPVTQHAAPRRATLAFETPGGESRTITTLHFNYFPAGKQWVTSGYFYEIPMEGGRTKVSVSPMFADAYKCKGFSGEQANFEDSCEISMLNATLLLLECKNIVTETVSPDVKFQKKRAKKGKLQLYEYKVLRVESVGKKRNGEGGESGVKQREHLCRGHFKTFTVEKPLLGKLVGRYWWQSQVRGNRELGTIEKEYSV
jgi:hypothetical protein